MIALKEAKKLRYGQILYSTQNFNSDGTAQKWKVIGKPKTWKTRPNKVRVPVKNELHNCDYLDETKLHLVAFEENKHL